MPKLILTNLAAALDRLRSAGIDADRIARVERDAAAHRRRHREAGTPLAEQVEVEEGWDVEPRRVQRSDVVTVAVKTQAKPGTEYVRGAPTEWLPPRLVVHILH